MGHYRSSHASHTGLAFPFLCAVATSRSRAAAHDTHKNLDSLSIATQNSRIKYSLARNLHQFNKLPHRYIQYCVLPCILIKTSRLQRKIFQNQPPRTTSCRNFIAYMQTVKINKPHKTEVKRLLAHKGTTQNTGATHPGWCCHVTCVNSSGCLGYHSLSSAALTSSKQHLHSHSSTAHFGSSRNHSCVWQRRKSISGYQR